jgi:CDGSH-type Zn-finger protein
MPLPNLPETHVCTRCGKSAAMGATIRPVTRMELDQRITLDTYGPDSDQFTDLKEIDLCECGNSHWCASKI